LKTYFVGADTTFEVTPSCAEQSENQKEGKAEKFLHKRFSFRCLFHKPTFDFFPLRATNQKHNKCGEQQDKEKKIIHPAS